jgi:hypothetical protein
VDIYTDGISAWTRKTGSRQVRRHPDKLIFPGIRAQRYDKSSETTISNPLSHESNTPTTEIHHHSSNRQDESDRKANPRTDRAKKGSFFSNKKARPRSTRAPGRRRVRVEIWRRILTSPAAPRVLMARRGRRRGGRILLEPVALGERGSWRTAVALALIWAFLQESWWCE